MMKSRSSHT